MNKYAVLVSNEQGDRPNFDAIGVSLEEARDIASNHGQRAECAPIGRAVASYADPHSYRVWSVVPSKKNEVPQ